MRRNPLLFIRHHCSSKKEADRIFGKKRWSGGKKSPRGELESLSPKYHLVAELWAEVVEKSKRLALIEISTGALPECNIPSMPDVEKKGRTLAHTWERVRRRDYKG